MHNLDLAKSLRRRLPTDADPGRATKYADINESVYLSDRVIVLSRPPSTVLAQVDIKYFTTTRSDQNKSHATVRGQAFQYCTDDTAPSQWHYLRRDAEVIHICDGKPSTLEP
jgi:hypothetical protein